MLTRVSRPIVAGLAASVLIAFPAAQVQTFSVTVHVHDGTLRSLNSLAPDDIEVRIDGKARPVRSVRPAGPFSLLLLLDTSASMSDAIPPSELTEAVAGIAGRLRPADQLRVAAFSTSVEMGPAFGSRLEAITGFLKTLSYNGATRVYDALDTSLTTLERQPGRRIIVVLSDGSDTASRMSGDEVLRRALRRDVQVWALLRSARLPGVKRRDPDRMFMQIVQDTGGMSVQLKEPLTLVSALADVLRYAREQYVLGVDAAAFDRDTHRVDVRTRRPGLTLHAPRSVALTIPCVECAVTGNSDPAPAAVRQPSATAPMPSFWDPVTGAAIGGPGVVAPKAVYSPPPPYTSSALKDRITGEVFMEVVVDETGRVQRARVTRSVRTDLDDSALATVKTWRFEPARKDGQAVAARLVVTMSFNVR